MSWLKTKRRDCKVPSGGERGSLTVEALLFLIPFMCAFFVLINAARFIQTEMLIHHAITQTAKQISTYSYVLTKAGISEKMVRTEAKSQKFLTSVDEAAKSIQDLAELLGNPDDIADGVFSLVKSEGSALVLETVAGGLAKESIRDAISLLSDDPDEYLTNLGVEGGLSGLSFSESQWNPLEGEKINIKIVVTYEMENLLFPYFEIGPYQFRQCASTVTW